MPKVLTTAQVKKRFGAFKWWPVRGSKSAITIEQKWVRNNIATVYIPELDRMPTFGGRFRGRVRFHRLGTEQLQRAFAECREVGVIKDIIFWSGSFVPRRIRGSRSLSRHSWGTALDLNSAQNPYMRTPARKEKPGSLHRVAPIFERHGFAWGGRWAAKPDGMHFELAEKLDYSTTCIPIHPDEGVRLKIQDKLVPVPIILVDGASYCRYGDLAAALGKKQGDADPTVPVAQILKAEGYDVTWHGSHGPRGTIYAYKAG